MLGLSSNTQKNSRRFNLRDLLNLMGADRAVRADAKVIKSITLTHVLNNETMNFGVKKTPASEEVYVLQIELREKRVPEKFESKLIEYMRPRAVFEFACGKEWLLSTTPRNGTRFIRAAYRLGWSKKEPQIEIPARTRNMDGVYVAILSAIVQLKTREGDTSTNFVARIEEILRLRRAEKKLQKQVDDEKQPKLRFALNADLKVLKNTLKALQS